MTPSRGAGPSPRVLVVEDDRAIARLVVDYLTAEGFAVEHAGDGESGIQLAREHRPDVLVLDLMLPGVDGVEVCRQVRTFSDAYILMLTARTDEVDRLVGLSVGADDYLGKPFSPRELAARLRAMLRRPRGSDLAGPGGDGEDARRRFGDLVIDIESREVTRGGELVDLTRTEFDVLATLSARPHAVFSRRRLLEGVWGEEWFGDYHVIDVHVANLRRKLGDDAATSRYVRTVRGVGYRMGEGT